VTAGGGAGLAAGGAPLAGAAAVVLPFGSGTGGAKTA
jgi:hypothetical protein